jgi:hypothetical protein
MARFSYDAIQGAAKALAEFDGAIEWEKLDDDKRTAYRHAAEKILEAAKEEIKETLRLAKIAAKAIKD